MPLPSHPMLGTIEIEPTGSNDTPSCDCCGRPSRTIWGEAFADGFPCAAYFIHWPLGRVLQHGAIFDIVIGRWGEGSTAKDRSVVSLAYRYFDDGPEFMVLDARKRPQDFSAVAKRRLDRGKVVGTALAKDVFAICQAVLLQDPRVAPLRGP